VLGIILKTIMKTEPYFLAPLFWLQNVSKMILEWPKEIKDKGQYIKILRNLGLYYYQTKITFFKKIQHQR
jgi:hypothetical protein